MWPDQEITKCWSYGLYVFFYFDKCSIIFCHFYTYGQCYLVYYYYFFGLHEVKVKGKAGIAVRGTPSHSHRYGVSLAIWDHTVSPATRHKWAHSAFTPASQAGTRFTYPKGMEGWVDLGDLLHTEMVYPATDGHPSKYWPGPVLIDFVDQANADNHYTTPPPMRVLWVRNAPHILLRAADK